MIVSKYEIKEQKRFCKHCGKRLMLSIVGAENFITPESECETYNSKTGERNLITQYECPERKKKFLFLNYIDFRHDSYALGDIFHLPKP